MTRNNRIHKTNEVPLTVWYELDIVFISDDEGDNKEFIDTDKDEICDILDYDSDDIDEFMNSSTHFRNSPEDTIFDGLEESESI